MLDTEEIRPSIVVNVTESHWQPRQALQVQHRELSPAVEWTHCWRACGVCGLAKFLESDTKSFRLQLYYYGRHDNLALFSLNNLVTAPITSAVSVVRLRFYWHLCRVPRYYYCFVPFDR